MSDNQDLFIATLKDLREDIRQIDNKLDYMNEVLTKNSTVLEEHERRSTASENRLDIIEDRHHALEKSADNIKGFFVYSGIILTTIGSLTALYFNYIAPLFKGK
jgi:cob(I)alamin adenosyltransferase